MLSPFDELLLDQLRKVLAESEAADTAEEETKTDVLIERLRPHEKSEVSAWLQGPGPDVVEVTLDESELPVPLRTSKLR